jgi:hypothetical protein
MKMLSGKMVINHSLPSLLYNLLYQETRIKTGVFLTLLTYCSQKYFVHLQRRNILGEMAIGKIARKE